MNQVDSTVDMQTLCTMLQCSTSQLRREQTKYSSFPTAEAEKLILHQQGKSVRVFSKLLYLKILNESVENCVENLDSICLLELWFAITNVEVEKLTLLREEISDVLDLLQFSQGDLCSLCDRCKFSRDEKRRFVTATLNLRVYTKTWLESKSEPITQFNDESLSWLGCESSPETSDSLLSPDLPVVAQELHRNSNQQLPVLVYHHPYDDQQPSTSVTFTDRSTLPYQAIFRGATHQNDRRSLSVSESGADSGASDSGLGSAISQNSLPTTTPPPSPGCFSTRVPAHHPHKISKVVCQSKTLPSNCHGQMLSSFGDRRQSNTAACLTRTGVTPPASPSYLNVTPRPMVPSAIQTVHRQSPAISAPGITPTKPLPPPLGEIMRSRSHESNLQARLLRSTDANQYPPHTVLPTVGAPLSPPPIFASSTLSLGTTSRPYTKQSDASIGSSPNILGQKGPSTVRKSATFGADDANLNLITTSAPRKSSQPQAQYAQQPSPSDFCKLNAGTPSGHAYSPISPKATGASGITAASTEALLSVPPKSPCGQVRMDHKITHRFSRMWKPSIDHCHYCSKVIGISGERCQDCRIKAHSGCKDLIDDTCGLTTAVKRKMYECVLNSLALNKRSPSSDAAISPSLSYSHSMTGSAIGTFLSHAVGGSGVESASSSSCNSSAPSTPAFGGLKSAGLAASPGINTGHAASASYAYMHSNRTKFTFPDPGSQPEVPFIHVESEPSESGFVSTVVNSESSGDASTLYGSWDGADGRLSQVLVRPITASHDTLASLPVHHLVDSQGSNEGAQGPGHQWLRNTWTMSTIRGGSSAWKEWTILYEDLKFPEGSLLGKGRFGEVHRAYWHQDVAVKLLNMDHVEDDRQLETFKQEVSTFRHTRHENLVLFVGCCLIPPRLGIVMNLCKGQTLYVHVHWRRDRFDMNKLINMAIQLCQGMSYLHGKKIVHKDFRTKNIFIEANNKAVITDFSIFSVRRLCQTSLQNFDIKGLSVPERWLCYLSPELTRMLKTWTSSEQVEELPFSESSDVYAFGTVWYELLTYEFPYRKLSTDAVIWQSCKGIKPGLTNLPVAKEIKDVLLQCWAFKSEDRPNFHQLLKTFEKLPRKRLERSPSQPVHLSRSAESIF